MMRRAGLLRRCRICGRRFGRHTDRCRQLRAMLAGYVVAAFIRASYDHYRAVHHGHAPAS